MSDPNVLHADFEYDDRDPDGDRAGIARVGAAAGGAAMNVKLFEIPGGQSLCPYHYEYEEEWLLVLSGSLTLRVPSGERALEAGALVCFPPGPDGAHKVTATGDEAARILMWSSSREPSIAVYPDSDKLGVFVSSPTDDLMVRRAEGHLDYYDGEV